MNENNNPAGLGAGAGCFAVHIGSFDPHVPERPCLDILRGTLQADYMSKPIEGVQPPSYFLPDEPVAGTDIISGFYHLSGWAVFPDRAGAEKARAAMAQAAIDAWQADTILMGRFLAKKGG